MEKIRKHYFQSVPEELTKKILGKRIRKNSQYVHTLFVNCKNVANIEQWENYFGKIGKPEEEILVGKEKMFIAILGMLSDNETNKEKLKKLIDNNNNYLDPKNFFKNGIGQAKIILDFNSENYWNFYGSLMEIIWLMLFMDLTLPGRRIEVCQNKFCNVIFIPEKPGIRYCSDSCGNKERVRKSILKQEYIWHTGKEE